MGDAAASGPAAASRQLPRKRTSSLGSVSSSQSAAGDFQQLPILGHVVRAGHAADPGNSTWLGQRSGSAPPERSLRVATVGDEDDMPASERHPHTLQLVDKAQDPVPSVPATSADAGSSSDPGAAGRQIDQLLLDGLQVHKDRILLLRSDLELEKFVNDPLQTRLRVAPPGFPPNLNSYQRLLIHRLADCWGVARELEPASNGAPVQNTPTLNAGSMISGTIVLVKNERTAFPLVRIASYATESSGEVLQSSTPSASPALVSLASKVHKLKVEEIPTTSGPARTIRNEPQGDNVAQAKIDAIVAGTPLPADISQASSLELSTASQSSVSTPGSSSSTSPVSTTGPVRIMSRATNAGGSGSRKSSSLQAGMHGPQSLTFEEREAAYQQARLRIFNESQAVAADRPPSAQRTTARNGRRSSGDHQSSASLQAHSVRNPHVMQETSYHTLLPGPRDLQQAMPHQAYPAPSSGSQQMSDSPPVFVYHSLTGAHGLSHAQLEHGQPFAYYAAPGAQMQMQHPYGNLQHFQGPPIQVTMPSPMQFHSPPPPNAYPAPGPVHLAGAPLTSGTFFIPNQARPTSAHSHSSHSSLSTTTSQSSIRTASTSSAQQSNLSVGGRYASSTGLNMRSVRQYPQAGPSSRQASRPADRPPLASTSTISSTSAQSRQSRSSSSSNSPAVSNTASSAPVTLSSRSSESNFSSPDRDKKDRLVEPDSLATPLPGPHPSLPARPPWIASESSCKASISSSASSASSRSSREVSSDLMEDSSAIRREDAHTPLSSASGAAGRSITADDKISLDTFSDLASVTEEEDVALRSTAQPSEMTVPPTTMVHEEAPPANSSEKVPSELPNGRQPRSDSQAHPQSQSSIVEYPPLRYDKVRGWTAMVAAPQNMLNASTLAMASSSDGLERRKAGPAPHHPRQPEIINHAENGSQRMALRQNESYWAHSQQYPFYPSPGFENVKPDMSGPAYHEGYAWMGTGPPSTHSTSPPSYGPQGLPFGSPVYSQIPHGQQVHVYYQPAPQHHMQPVYYQAVPQQLSQYSQPVQQQQEQQQGVRLGRHSTMTAADMMENGEMLYSYDIPRPVPRSGATLFDPNAGK